MPVQTNSSSTLGPILILSWAGLNRWVPGQSRGHASEGGTDPGHLNGRLQSFVALWGVGGLGVTSLRSETIMKDVETGHLRYPGLSPCLCGGIGPAHRGRGACGRDAEG